MSTLTKVNLSQRVSSVESPSISQRATEPQEQQIPLPENSSRSEPVYRTLEPPSPYFEMLIKKPEINLDEGALPIEEGGKPRYREKKTKEKEESPVMSAPIGQNALILVEKASIEQAYQIFQESQARGVSYLTQASDSLASLEKISWRLWREKDYEAAVSLDQEIRKYTKWIQEMNASCPCLTLQDCRGVMSFFTPPREEFYFDDSTKEKYYKPNPSELLELGSRFFADGEYQGMGVSKNMHYERGPALPCDVLYLTKQDDQIKYESEYYGIGEGQSEEWSLTRLKSWASSYAPDFYVNYQREKMREKLQPRINRQEKSQKKVVGYLKQKIIEWNYSDFQLCGYEELVSKTGLPKERAIRIHAIILYHKKWDKE